jgi:alpha-L-fucosidase
VKHSHCGVKRLGITAMILVGIVTPLLRAQDEPTSRHDNPRDAAEAQEALKGWWTQALKTRDERLAWWRDARFGCFIHWGVYSDLAGEYKGKRGGGYAEHIMRQLKIPRQEYLENVVANFDPEKFNADEWVKLIKGAGMRYVVITAKHHDGFAMWPSDVTKYNIRDATKFKRDPMKELSDACHANGIKFGFYYSHAFDWEHPDAPGNDWDYENPGGDRKLLGGTDWYNLHPDVLERVKHYVDQKAIPQLVELVNKYHPDIFWMDTPGKLPPSEQLRIVKAVRKADPNVVINGRAARGMGQNWGDYQDTADRPAEVRDPGGDWEAIPSVNNSYGYNKWDNHYSTPEFFIRLIAKTAAKGGNTLLNIGPKGDGTIDENATRILQGIGKWMEVNGESIHGTQRTPLDRQSWGDSTVKDSTIYLHVFDWPSDGKLTVGGLVSDVSNAHLLADKSELKWERFNDKDVVVNLPEKTPDATDSVIILKIAGDIKTVPGRLLLSDVPNNRLLAFDAQTSGKRLTYGDGKEGRYYVTGFGKNGDTISWKIRDNLPATFDMTMGYTIPQSGSCTIKIGRMTFATRLDAATSLSKATVARVKLEPGEREIVIEPGEAANGISVFDVNLTPVKE